MRREFANIIKLKNVSHEETEKVINAFDVIFRTDNLIRTKYKDDFDKIKEQRNILMRPLVDDLFALLNDYVLKGLKKSLFSVTGMSYI